MNLFSNKPPKEARNGLRRDAEFKLFVESRMAEDGGRFAGYKDDAVLSILEKEFTMYKHASPTKSGEAEAKKSKIPTFKSITSPYRTCLLYNLLLVVRSRGSVKEKKVSSCRENSLVIT